MAGNVSEWVLDVYRPLSYEDVSDFAPFRGNVFQTRVTDAEVTWSPRIAWAGSNTVKLSGGSHGQVNYRKANNINYLDGDYQSLLGVDWAQKNEDLNNTIRCRIWSYFPYQRQSQGI